MSEEAKRIFAQTFVSHPYSRGDTWVPQKRAVAAVELALASSQAEIARLKEALEWYGENARLCRLIHSGGDAGRNALASDGGKRARSALSETRSDS